MDVGELVVSACRLLVSFTKGDSCSGDVFVRSIRTAFA
jgi:hypothetical protein